MSLFTEWNTLLLNEYFSPDQFSEDVWIRTSREELDSFGLHLGGAEGLIEAVKTGPEWLNYKRANSADLAKCLANQRKSVLRSAKYVDPELHSPIYIGTKAPTYLPCLAIWVLASAVAEEGFYAKVKELLGDSFDLQNNAQIGPDMEFVWKDLERWSCIETKGRFGSFKVRVLGAHRFVGIAKSQCMISRKDSFGVRQLFASCHLRPSQELSNSLFKRILDLGINSNYLSNGLRNAMRSSAYHPPLLRLLDSMLKAWDGRLVWTEGNQPAESKNHQFVPNLEEETTLKLVPSGEESESWEIQWRFPASGPSNKCSLIVDNIRIPSRLEQTNECFSSVGQSHQNVCRAVLLQSAVGDIQVRFEYEDEDAYEVGGGVRLGRINRRKYRLMVWDTLDPRLGEELVERDYPISGPLYLACCSSHRDKLELYLRSEQISNEHLSTGGLPSGWNLICIPEVRRLTPNQRAWLTDGNSPVESLARIRFVGGRPIIRAGTKVYAYYDLPILELEAPQASWLQADGLDFEEISLGPRDLSRTLIRRFKINICDKQKSAFDVKVTCRKEQLALARLRLSIPEGVGLGIERPFGVDRFGRSISSDDGLRGALLSRGESKYDGIAGYEPLSLSQHGVKWESEQLSQETIAAKFLDSLAQLGSMAYGTARDQINRLAESQNMDVQPALLLLELRSRGHLEIQTENKGHMVRIHMVPPTLYMLPVKYDGLLLFGISGSLRLQHWISIFTKSSCLILSERKQLGNLPVVRLACIDIQGIKEVAESLGFLVVHNPSYSILQWAGSLEQATIELSSWGWENFSANLSQLQQLHPASARFNPVIDGVMTVDRKKARQLFRLDDPSVPGLQVYVLGSVQQNEKTSFGFIHDSRWGIWISIAAFATMLKNYFNIHDACPWPIHYENKSRTLLIPARLRPPFVIERALVLCSGSSPIEIQTSGMIKDGAINLVNQGTGESVGLVSLVYDELKFGVWLLYRWIPEGVAQRMAQLLGGEIRSFDPLSDD